MSNYLTRLWLQKAAEATANHLKKVNPKLVVIKRVLWKGDLLEKKFRLIDSALKYSRTTALTWVKNKEKV